MPEWFARPVLHVSSVEASLRFDVDRLGFTVSWRYEEDGRARVAQVDRRSCALILSDQWPEKVGKGLMFISLNVEPETREAEVAALDALRVELEARGVPVKDGHWATGCWWSRISTATSFSSPIRTSRRNERGAPFSWIGAPRSSCATPMRQGTSIDRGSRCVRASPCASTTAGRVRPGYKWLQLVGRLKAGTSYDQARAELETLFTAGVIQAEVAMRRRRTPDPAHPMPQPELASRCRACPSRSLHGAPAIQ